MKGLLTQLKIDDVITLAEMSKSTFFRPLIAIKWINVPGFAKIGLWEMYNNKNFASN